MTPSIAKQRTASYAAAILLWLMGGTVFVVREVRAQVREDVNVSAPGR